jgi:hypothetical protein
MRPLAVVVVDVDTEHAFEVTPVEHEQPVQALGAHGTDEALRDRVRLRCSHRSLHDPDALAAENLIERAAVLAVAVADQEADAPIAEVETEVAATTADSELVLARTRTHAYRKASTPTHPRERVSRAGACLGAGRAESNVYATIANKRRARRLP